jgi:hypothetical protein
MMILRQMAIVLGLKGEREQKRRIFVCELMHEDGR